MSTTNIHAAKTHLSRLVDQALQGEEVIIAKAGKALVKLVPVTPSPLPTKRRLGGLEGMFTVPDDIKTPFAKEIEEMFYGEDTT